MSPPCHPCPPRHLAGGPGGSRWLIPAEPRGGGSWQPPRRCQCRHPDGARCAQLCRGDSGTWLVSPGWPQAQGPPLGWPQVRPHLSPGGTSQDGGWALLPSGRFRDFGNTWVNIFGNISPGKGWDGSSATWMCHPGPGSVVALAMLGTPRWPQGSPGCFQAPSFPRNSSIPSAHLSQQEPGCLQVPAGHGAPAQQLPAPRAELRELPAQHGHPGDTGTGH